MKAVIALVTIAAAVHAREDPAARHRRLARASTPSNILEDSLTTDQGCSAYYTPKAKTTVAQLLKETKLSEAGLLNANPALCNDAPAGKAICVAGPTLPQFGTTDLDHGCIEFVYVKKGDTCSSIAAAHNVSLAEFQQLNPGAGDECLTLWAGYWSCLEGGGLTESTLNDKNATKTLHAVAADHRQGSNSTVTAHSRKSTSRSSSTRRSTRTSSRTSTRTSTPAKATKAAVKAEAKVSHAEAKSDDSKSEAKAGDDKAEAKAEVKVSVASSSSNDDSSDSGDSSDSTSGFESGHITFYRFNAAEGGVAVYCENTPGCKPDNDLRICAVSPSILQGGSACGKTVAISGKSGVNHYKICDECPECDRDHFDMTVRGAEDILGSAFESLGVGDMKWKIL